MLGKLFGKSPAPPTPDTARATSTASASGVPAVLNVGGNSKLIPIPPHFGGWRHDLLDIDPATPEGKEILQLNRATRYIPTSPENYKGLETAGRSAGLI